MGGVGGELAVTSKLEFGSSIPGVNSGQGTVFCSCAKHSTPIVPLSTLGRLFKRGLNPNPRLNLLNVRLKFNRGLVLLFECKLTLG